MISERVEAGFADRCLVRRTQGARDGIAYLPRVLDGASNEMIARVPAVLPPPARLLYRRVSAPSYRRALAVGA